MNRSTLATNKSKALFSAEVYREEEEKPRRSEPIDEVSAELSRLRSELRGEARALRTALARPAKVPAELLAEIATLRATVDELMTQTSPKRSDLIAKTLAARGIEGAAASAFARIARTKKELGTTEEKLAAAARAVVKTTPWPPAMFGKGKSIVALVGPAGVGKTTTAAKLAARAKMAKKTVALVSCDAFRVGAMDQLGKYAELMDCTFHTATSAEELVDVLLAETADVIIVDCSGRAIEADATEAFLGAPELRSSERNGGRHVEVMLCLPASLRAADATRAHRDFAIARPSMICITKLDETDAPSGIAHAAFATKLPVSTLCNGQRVPEDIVAASEDAIATCLFPHEVESSQ